MPNGYRRLFLLVACLTLLAAGARAQVHALHNEVGIFTVENPDGCATAQADVPAFTRLTAYVVLTSPYNEELGRPVDRLGGFAFRVGLPASVYLLGTTPPAPMCCILPPDFIMGIELPVTGDQVTLLALDLMPSTAEPALVSLMPAMEAPDPQAFAFTDLDDDYSFHVMHPVSGSFDVPVFAINWDGDLSFCETVPDEGVSFGGVKALYR